MSSIPARISLLLWLTTITSFAPAIGYGKALYWQALAVTAELDNEGKLHVKERQEMVFDGVWNGGERSFRLSPGQRLWLNRISRVSPSGEEIPLRQGDLAEVDQYKWFRDNVLRWRSRLPSDPPFANKTIIYELDYTMSNILLRTATGFRLDHDFAFPNRSGAINGFSLELELDSDWQSPKGSRISMGSGVLPPGRGMVVRLDLTNSSPTALSDVQTYVKRAQKERMIRPSPGTPAALRYAMAALILLFYIWRAGVFYHHEKKQHRFADPIAPAIINTAWLEEHVFAMQPEVVGAVWDKTTSTYEVAAILARMVVEGKIKSWVQPKVIPIFGTDVLHMELLVDREELGGYERKIVDGYFIAGDKTDTKTIKKYYRESSKTFMPVSVITEPLAKNVKGLTAKLKDPLFWGWVLSALLFVVAFFILLATCFIYQGECKAIMIAVIAGIVVSVIGLTQSSSYAKKVLHLHLQMLRVFWPQLLLLGILGSLLITGMNNFSPLALIGIGLLYLSQISLTFFVAKNRDSEEGVALRIRLACAREYFKNQLRKEKPDLQDTWFPYLIAFGLGKHIDRWFKKFGETIHSNCSSASGLSGSSDGGFSGGGGLFGGAGASGSWVSAAGQLTGGSSTSGAGGGGGSSGGGGGGGW